MGSRPPRPRGIWAWVQVGVGNGRRKGMAYSLPCPVPIQCCCCNGVSRVTTSTTELVIAKVYFRRLRCRSNPSRADKALEEDPPHPSLRFCISSFPSLLDEIDCPPSSRPGHPSPLAIPTPESDRMFTGDTRLQATK